MSNTKNCLVCGKEFKPCNTCISGARDIYNWKKVTCCREHHDYLMPIIEYSRHEISKYEAKKQLEKAINEYGNVTFADNIASLANEILAEDKKIKKHTKLLNDVVIPDISDDISITE